MLLVRIIIIIIVTIVGPLQLVLNKQVLYQGEFIGLVVWLCIRYFSPSTVMYRRFEHTWNKVISVHDLVGNKSNLFIITKTESHTHKDWQTSMQFRFSRWHCELCRIDHIQVGNKYI